jgi:hypothetical protein
MIALMVEADNSEKLSEHYSKSIPDENEKNQYANLYQK